MAQNPENPEKFFDDESDNPPSRAGKSGEPAGQSVEEYLKRAQEILDEGDKATFHFKVGDLLPVPRRSPREALNELKNVLHIEKVKGRAVLNETEEKLLASSDPEEASSFETWVVRAVDEAGQKLSLVKASANPNPLVEKSEEEIIGLPFDKAANWILDYEPDRFEEFTSDPE